MHLGQVMREIVGRWGAVTEGVQSCGVMMQYLRMGVGGKPGSRRRHVEWISRMKVIGMVKTVRHT